MILLRLWIEHVIAPRIERVMEADHERRYNSGRTPYKLQSEAERTRYAIEDLIGDFTTFWRIK